MAKSPKQPIMTKKHLARVEREAIQTRWIIIGSIITIVLVVGLIGYGILDQFVLQPNKAVAIVGEDKVSLRDLQEQASLTRYNLVNQYDQITQMAQYFGSDPNTQQYFQNQLSSISFQLEPVTLGQSVLDQLIADRLIRKEAERRGIEVTKADIDNAIQEAFGYFPGGTPTPNPTQPIVPTSTLNPTQLALVPPTSTPTSTPITETLPTPTITPTLEPTSSATSTPQPTPTPFTEDAFKERFNESLKNLNDIAKVSEKTLRRYFENSLYREKVKEAILAELNIIREQEQVWARHILVNDEETAKQVVDRLNKGEDFSTLATELSQDTGSAVNGGDLGWFGRGRMIPEFETAAFGLEIGQISDPVKSSAGFHIIQVLGKEMRPISESEYEQERETKFTDWIEEQRKEANVEVLDNWFDKIPTEPSVPQTSPISQ